MKKFKQILAVLGISLLLLLYGSTLIFALLDTPHSREWFQASVGATILLPILLYAILLVAKQLENRRPQPKSEIKNIIFDVGNVLIRFDWEAHLDSYHFAPEVRAAVKRATFPSPEWEERDRGARTHEEYLQTFFAKEPSYEKEIRQVIDEESRSLHAFDYAKTWIEYLRQQGYRTYLLSNISEHMVQGFYQELDVIPQMDGVIFSFEAKQIKPEPEIYQTLLSSYHLRPEECVFLDDRKENVAAAERLGIRGIVFRDFRSAAKELEKLGIQ